MTIGETLKRARKKLDVSLDEVANVTKIAKMFLLAMENDDFDQLPGGVYTRHFLRSYAAFLKLDPDIVTAEYHEQYQVKPEFVVHQEQTKLDDAMFRAERRQNLRLIGGVSLVAAIVAVVVFMPFGWYEPLMQLNGVQVEKSTHSQESIGIPFAREMDALAPTGRADADKSTADNGDTAVNAPATRDSSSPPLAETLAKPTSEAPPGEDHQKVQDVPAEQSGFRPSVGRIAGLAEKRPASSASANADSTRVTEPAAPENPAVFLPVKDLTSLQLTAGEAQSLDDVFIIQALENVGIEVVIGNDRVTKTSLKKGQYRAYVAGAYNSIFIDDAARVLLQQGDTLLSPDAEGVKLHLRGFRKGRLPEAYQSWLSRIDH